MGANRMRLKTPRLAVVADEVLEAARLSLVGTEPAAWRWASAASGPCGSAGGVTCSAMRAAAVAGELALAEPVPVVW